MTIDKKKLDSLLNNQKIEFSKTEKLIHNYVVENPEQVIYDSLNSISTRLGIGEASLVRYFKKIGFASFNQFKMNLYNILEGSRIKNDIPYVESVTNNLINVINNTKESIDLNSIDKAAEIILSSRQVFIAGMGISYTSAQDMFSRLLRIGVNSSIVTDSHFGYMYTALLDEDCSVILYSFSGETAEMVKLAKSCKERNIKIIVISNYSNSTLFPLADVFIQTKGFENDITSGFFGSKISQIYVSDLLVTKCALSNESRTKEYNQKITNLIIK